MSARLFKFFERQSVEREVESELCLHLELLTEENLRQGMTQEEAEQAALKRFGNVARIKDQCVQISHRNRPVMRVLKASLIVVFAAGVLTRISSADIYGTQIGNMLIAIATLGGLLIYLRGPRFSRSLAEAADPSPLGLREDDKLFAAGNAREFSPLERIVND